MFFVFQLFYGQNAEERKKIVASYNQVKIHQLNEKFTQEQKLQQECGT